MRKVPVRQGKYTKITKTRQAKRTARRHWNWFWRLSRKQKAMIIVAPVLAVLILTPLITYMAYARDISDAERLMNRNNTGIVLKDVNGEVFYSIGKAEHRNQITLNDTGPYTAKALIASEDKDFYKHGGFNVFSIFRAAFTRYGGGSTITQQLAKNTLLTDQRSFFRKYQELFMSIAIEQNYSKDKILEMYLNSVYFGENAFGIEDAAKAYFNKAPKDLTLPESAMLIGILPAPSAYSPISGNMEYAKSRQSKVLTRMVAEKYITGAEKDAAATAELAYGKGASATQSDEAPHYAEMVIKQMSDKYGYEKVMRSGYQVTTTLDLKLQKILKANVDGHMKYIQANGGSNAAAVAIDPKSGEVRALVGSADWNNEKWGKVNIVTTARQPGSSFKPIYYAGALDSGEITPATVLDDRPRDFGGNYVPLNADKKLHGTDGKIAARNAISMSLNIPSVEVMQKYGIDKSIQIARDLGITTLDPDKNYGLSLALGSAETTPMEMTNAYAAFANGGKQYPTTVIRQIEDKFNKKIFTLTAKAKQTIGEAGAFLISSMLSDNSARAPIFGGSLTVNGHTAAVKTGTTNDSRDAWTIGYTPSIALGVWVGNNDNAAMRNGGAGMSGPIWRETLNDWLKGKPNEQFVVPSSVVQRYACKETGGLASRSGYGTYQEYFKAGALPDPCQAPEEPKISVCDLSSKQMVTITETQFNDNQSTYSKNADDCKQIEIQVCDLSSGKVVMIDEADYDSTLYSKSTANCKPKNTATISACNISSGEVEQVDSSSYDNAAYTTNYTMTGGKCQPASGTGAGGSTNNTATTTP